MGGQQEIIKPDGSYDVVLCGPRGLPLYTMADRLFATARERILRVAILEDIGSADGRPISDFHRYPVRDEDNNTWDLLKRYNSSVGASTLSPRMGACQPKLYVEKSLLSTDPTDSSDAPKLLSDTLVAVAHPRDHGCSGAVPPCLFPLLDRLGHSSTRSLDSGTIDELLKSMKRKLSNELSVTFIPGKVLTTDAGDGLRGVLTLAMYRGISDRLIRLLSARVLFIDGQSSWPQIDFNPALPLPQTLSMLSASSLVVGMKLVVTFSHRLGLLGSISGHLSNRSTFSVLCDSEKIIYSACFTCTYNSDLKASETVVEVNVCGDDAVQRFLSEGNQEKRKLCLTTELIDILEGLKSEPNERKFVEIKAGCAQADEWEAGVWDYCEQEQPEVEKLSADDLRQNIMSYSEKSYCGYAKKHLKLPTSDKDNCSRFFHFSGFTSSQGPHAESNVALSVEDIIQECDQVSIEICESNGDQFSADINLVRDIGTNKKALPLSLFCFFLFLLLIGLGCLLAAAYFLFVSIHQDGEGILQQSACDTNSNAMKYASDLF